MEYRYKVMEIKTDLAEYSKDGDRFIVETAEHVMALTAEEWKKLTKELPVAIRILTRPCEVEYEEIRH